MVIAGLDACAHCCRNFPVRQQPNWRAMRLTRMIISDAAGSRRARAARGLPFAVNILDFEQGCPYSWRTAVTRSPGINCRRRLNFALPGFGAASFELF